MVVVDLLAAIRDTSGHPLSLADVRIGNYVEHRSEPFSSVEIATELDIITAEDIDWMTNLNVRWAAARV